MFKVATIGFGAIGQELARLLQADDAARVIQIVTTSASMSRAQDVALTMAPHARLGEKLDHSPQRLPDLVVECAGHAAISEHVIPALQAHIPCVVASVGALAAPGLHALLVDAATRGGARVHLIAGAIGGIDALDAARLGGLDRVLYTGRKPPRTGPGRLQNGRATFPRSPKRTSFFGAARARQRWPTQETPTWPRPSRWQAWDSTGPRSNSWPTQP